MCYGVVQLLLACIGGDNAVEVLSERHSALAIASPAIPRGIPRLAQAREIFEKRLRVSRPELGVIDCLS